MLFYAGTKERSSSLALSFMFYSFCPSWLSSHQEKNIVAWNIIFKLLVKFLKIQEFKIFYRAKFFQLNFL